MASLLNLNGMVAWKKVFLIHYAKMETEKLEIEKVILKLKRKGMFVSEYICHACGINSAPDSIEVCVVCKKLRELNDTIVINPEATDKPLNREDNVLNWDEDAAWDRVKFIAALARDTPFTPRDMAEMSRWQWERDRKALESLKQEIETHVKIHVQHNNLLIKRDQELHDTKAKLERAVTRLKEFADYDNPNSPEKVCWPVNEYMTKARTTLAEIEGK